MIGRSGYRLLINSGLAKMRFGRDTIQVSREAPQFIKEGLSGCWLD